MRRLDRMDNVNERTRDQNVRMTIAHMKSVTESRTRDKKDYRRRLNRIENISDSLTGDQMNSDYNWTVL